MGAPDPRRGRARADDLTARPVTAISYVADVSTDELLRHVGTELVRHKVPRSIEFTSEPLRHDAGTVRRSALRDARTPDGASSSTIDAYSRSASSSRPSTALP